MHDNLPTWNLAIYRLPTNLARKVLTKIRHRLSDRGRLKHSFSCCTATQLKQHKWWNTAVLKGLTRIPSLPRILSNCLRRRFLPEVTVDKTDGAKMISGHIDIDFQQAERRPEEPGSCAASRKAHRSAPKPSSKRYPVADQKNRADGVLLLGGRSLRFNRYPLPDQKRPHAKRLRNFGERDTPERLTTSCCPKRPSKGWSPNIKFKLKSELHIQKPNTGVLQGTSYYSRVG